MDGFLCTPREDGMLGFRCHGAGVLEERDAPPPAAVTSAAAANGVGT
jgi:hypothetical protein